MKFLADIEVEEGLKDSDGDLGSNGQVLSSTSSGTNWIDAPTGTIGGSITDGRVAVGAPTANSIEGDDSLKYTGSSTQRFIVGDGTTTPAIFIDGLVGYGGGINFRMRTPNVSTQNESEIRLDPNKYLQIRSSEKIYLDGETNGVVITGNGQITVKEFANSTGPTHTAGFGTLWVDPNSGSANKLYYTDDVGTDYDLTASSGIGGATVATQVAFGSATTSAITSSAEATFLESAGKTLLQVGSTGGKAQSIININQTNNDTSRARLELSRNTSTRGFLGIAYASTDVTLYSNDNLVLDSDGDDVIITTQTASNVGVGNTSPTEKLDVTGRIKASAGVQVGNETGTSAVAGLVGTLRYRTYSDASFDYSAVDVCMQDGPGAGDYEWINIVTKRW